MGGDGGNPSTQLTNGIVYAFRGKSDGTFVTQLQLAYYIPSHPDVTNRYQTGDVFSTYPAVGGNTGTESGWISCPINQAAIGFMGRFGQSRAFVNQFKLMCGTVNDLQEPNFDSLTAAVGADVGTFFNAGGCDQDGLEEMGYLSGANVRSGAVLDQFSGICRFAGF
jgi:hypothetical protein